MTTPTTSAPLTERLRGATFLMYEAELRDAAAYHIRKDHEKESCQGPPARLFHLGRRLQRDQARIYKELREEMVRQLLGEGDYDLTERPEEAAQ